MVRVVLVQGCSSVLMDRFKTEALQLSHGIRCLGAHQYLGSICRLITTEGCFGFGVMSFRFI